MIRLLTRAEQDELHHRYRNSDLFRHWSPLLNRLEWEMQELDAMTLYREAEIVLQKLRLEADHRDEMISYLFKQLLADFKTIEDEQGKCINRSIEQAECSSVTVMAIVLTSLMNAVEKGHEKEDFDNQPMCVAIAGMLRNHAHFRFLFEDFFSRQKDNRGKKIVITRSDPMQAEETLGNMDDEAQKEVKDMVDYIEKLTAGLQPIFNEHWEEWKQLCLNVCLDKELYEKLKNVTPRHNTWKMNQKMVCNIVGIFRQHLDINVSVNAINTALADTQLGSYLRNHAGYGTSDTDLNKLQHERVVKMLPKVA